MAADGWNLILVARRGEILSQLAGDLIAKYGVKAAVITADLSKPEAAGEIVAKLADHNVKIDALINNAGFGYYGWIVEQDIEPLERMIEVNISSLLRLTRLIVPGMKERGRGWVMNVASTASFQAVPSSGVYAATKAFVLSFSVALSTELTGTGVSVTCLCPGVTRTGFARVAGAKHLDTDFRGAMTAKDVAQQGYQAMIKGKQIVVTGGINKFLALATRFAPRSFAAKLAMKVMKGRR